MTDEQREQTQKKWFDEAEEALNRTAEALRTAWDETRDQRGATLAAAKEAANRLAKAIDQGIEAARQSWDPSTREQTPPEATDAGSSPPQEEE